MKIIVAFVVGIIVQETKFEFDEKEKEEKEKM